MKWYKIIGLAVLFVFIAGILQLSCKSDSSPLNVVLISIDTLRPDHLGCYGYERLTSPTIDRIAREGILFENAFSSTTWTLPAHLALLTSLPNLVHGVIDEDSALDENRHTLAEILNDNGYKTIGIFTSPYLLPRFGFSQGFDEYLDMTLFDKKLDESEMIRAAERGGTTPGAMEKVAAFLNQDTKNPFFLFLHLFDVHADFDPPEPYNSMFDPGYSGSVPTTDIMNNPAIHKDMSAQDLNHLVALYDGEIRFVDETGISRLMDLLTENGLKDQTLIIITSDHGEEFFEQGVIGHRQNLFDTTLRIPLIIWCPGRVPAGKSAKNQVRIIDIMPTILDILRLPQSQEGLGKSLVPLFLNQVEEENSRPLFTVVKNWVDYQESLRTTDYKIILDYKRDERLFYDLLNDPEEMSPILIKDQLEFRGAMDQFFRIRWNLTSFEKTLPQSGKVAPELDPELIERLKSLGYIK